MEEGSCKIFCTTLLVIFFTTFTAIHSRADVKTVEDQDIKKYLYAAPKVPVSPPAKKPSKELLKVEITTSVTQGVDSNPLLDSTHKADNYTQEMFDLHFKYPLVAESLGKTDVRFGVNALNVNYFRVTDVNIFDGVADVYLDHNIAKDLDFSAGYVFESMWYPHNREGNYLGNSFVVSLKHTVTKWLYQRAMYRLEYRSYFDRKVRLSNYTLSSELRADLRNTCRYELGIYIGKKVKLRVLNDYYVNESNYQYMDYYDYWANRTGCALTAILSKRLFGTAGFYYQRRNYYERQVSDSEALQRDNLYIVTGSLIYDMTDNLSAFVNYSHSENHTNEPLERYVDTMYSGGLSYFF
ncbi:MAG: hypothetical protein NC938_05005 [Candidatus Omnitrophica bacterium]|nr:hypothetical protein [Candidatus Omnitrophota bacterium]